MQCLWWELKSNRQLKWKVTCLQTWASLKPYLKIQRSHVAGPWPLLCWHTSGHLWAIPGGQKRLWRTLSLGAGPSWDHWGLLDVVPKPRRWGSLDYGGGSPDGNPVLTFCPQTTPFWTAFTVRWTKPTTFWTWCAGGDTRFMTARWGLMLASCLLLLSPLFPGKWLSTWV